MNTTLKVILTIIITALVVGAGTYYITTRQINNKNADLQRTINDLKSEISDLNNKVDNQDTSNDTANNTNNNCQSTNFTASVNNGDAAAGTYYLTLNLKNTGSTDCNYNGQTTASLTNSNDQVIGSAKTTESANLTVKVGQTIYSALAFPNPNNYPDSNACKSGVTNLAINIPNDSTAIKITNIDQKTSYANYYCSGFSIGNLSITQP